MTLLVVFYAYFAVMLIGGILSALSRTKPPPRRRTPHAPTEE